jgi:hypothetical protein
MRFRSNRFVSAGWIAATVVLAAGCERRQPSSTAPASSAAVASAAPTAPASSAAQAVPADAGAGPLSPIPKEMVEKALNPEHLPVYDGPTGSVEGTIFVTGPASPDLPVDTTQCPAALDTYGKVFREGVPATPGGPRPLADAVVIAVGYSGHYLAEKNPSESVTINERCGYPTRTIAMTFGQSLEISNASKFPFAPMLDTAPSMAVMMTAPGGAGDPVRIYPRLPGHSILTDMMQPFVQEDVYVLRHPLHAVSGLDGHYRIDGIPVGAMSIAAQHLGVRSQGHAPVTVEAGVVQKLDLTLVYAPKEPSKLEKHDMVLR